MLKIDTHWVWDFWIADDGARFHLFFLFAAKTWDNPELRHRNAQVGHAVSDDLRSWEVLGRVLDVGVGFDATAAWTGCVVPTPTGRWRMFYTGTRFLGPGPRPGNVQAVGVAESVNLDTWSQRPRAVVEADGRWYERLGTSSWHEEAWRDPWVFPDPSGDGWHMLVTARSAAGPVDDRGVIGHAVSNDLRCWTVKPPLTRPGSGFAHLEVPQIVRIDGQWVLLFSCDAGHLSAERRRRRCAGGIWAMTVQDPTQPYDVGRAELITDATIYSGRAVQDRGGGWVLLAFETGGPDQDFIGVITDPLPLTVSGQGRVVVDYPAPTATVIGADSPARTRTVNASASTSGSSAARPA